MQLLHDMHIHSRFSIDAKEEIPKMCHAAVKKGMKTICFAEHLDLHPNDAGSDYFNYEAFSQAIERAREAFGDQLEILKGVEFGEPHLYPRAFDRLMEKDVDLILGAVHRIGDYLVGSEKVRKIFSKREILEKYYAEVLRTVRFGGFDVLAHLDLPKRYMQVPFTRHPLIDKILREIVHSEFLLEINTSPLRRGRNKCCPDTLLLDQYIDRGGKQVTVGSDAHTSQAIGKDFPYVRQLLHATPLMVGVFRQRQFQPETYIPDNSRSDTTMTSREAV